MRPIWCFFISFGRLTWSVSGEEQRCTPVNVRDKSVSIRTKANGEIKLERGLAEFQKGTLFCKIIRINTYSLIRLNADILAVSWLSMLMRQQADLLLPQL